MKILAIHNFHRKGSASGDDQVFVAETKLLESHGCEVVKYSVKNDEFDDSGVIGKIKSTFGMLWSFKHYNAVKNIIRKERPDIVHVHTFFPLLSPSILYAAKKNGCTVIATLHDTRFVCPCATSLRSGVLCNDCKDGHYLRMSKYRCFKNSRIQSLLVAGIFKFHRIRRSFYNQIDKYICLNETQKKLLIEAGFDESKILKKYNFVEDVDSSIKISLNENLPQRYAVYYGRIGEEKGIRMLMKIWDLLPEIPLVVMGGGPLKDEFSAWAQTKEQVYFLGYVEHEKCLLIVKSSEFVVFPSIWYEGCSMVEIEAESLEKGLVATDLGFSAEAIEDGENGYKIPLGNVEKFVNVIRKLWLSPDECRYLGKKARADYESKYTPEENYNCLINIYQAALNNCRL